MPTFDQWLATPADEDLRRTFAEPDLDDAGWEPLAVPGHWRSNPAFADHDGPLLHRTRFEQAAGAPDRRWWLRFDGIFYQGDVWLDGAYLGDTEGYFFAHEFEVTEQLRSRREHLLAVEVACSPQTDRTRKRNITGVFQHWDCLDPDWNPGGIWRPVRLEESGPVRIRHLVTRCVEASAERAVLAVTANLDAAGATDVHLRTTVGAVDHGTDRTLAAGPNTVEWTVTVDRPRLWWPHALGEAHLEAVSVEVRLRDEAGSRVSDRRRFRTGLRQVSMRRWQLSVNGERLFCKGTNLGPTRMALGEATPDELAADIQRARDANLDLVRIHGHVGRPETYDAADRLGVLLWQDFPLQWGYARSIRWQAQRQATEMVALLAHHPSVAVWCGHNEPIGIDVDTDDLGDPRLARRVGMRFLAAQQAPTWNKSVLDRAVKRSIEKADGTRPVVKHSGVLPRLPALQGTDSHLYFGWYWGDDRDLPGFARALPSQVRFPREFGAQAVPETDDFMGADAWPDLDWERLGHAHNLQLGVMDRHVPRDGRSYEEWKAATQAHQAEVVRHHIEQLRRLKYRPTGGFCQFSFADSHPSVTWSVLDHERRPKPAHAALVAACAPVIVVADRLPASVSPGDALALDVHVVSDRRIDLSGQIEAEVRWDGGAHRWSFEGEVPADSCVRVGTIQLEVPDAPGELVVHLHGRVGDDVVSRCEATAIT
ncbi:MAG: glycosyl hydrolase 2 galactose-binding domain-containing protein [Acidimicrobiia bacterium]